MAVCRRTEFEVDSNYKLASLLGQCCAQLGSVHLAKHVPTGKIVAVRKYNLELVSEDEEFIQHEVHLMSQLKHANVLSCLYSFVVGSILWVITPYFHRSSADVFQKTFFPDGVPEKVLVPILKDVIIALEYLHNKGCIHRSVKASHVLISESGRSCLGGLRYAGNVIQNGKWQKTIHQFPHRTPRNWHWLSPELLEQNMLGYNERSDIYSVGILAIELATGVVPFSGLTSTHLLLEKLKGESPRVNENVAGSYSSTFHQFVAVCVQRDPHSRPFTSQLLEHQLVKKASGLPLNVLPKLADLKETEFAERSESNDVLSATRRLSGLRFCDDESNDDTSWNF